MTRVDLFLRGGDQLVEQVVGLHAEAFAPADFDVGAGFIFLIENVAEFSGAARRERHHLIRKMRVVIRSPSVPKAPERFNHRVLCLRLPRVDYIVDLGYISEMRMIFLTIRG